MGHHQGIPMRNKKRRKPAIRFVVYAAFVLAAVLAARSEIPAFSDWLDSLLRPNALQAKKACQQLALNAARDPSTAVLVLPGTLTTQQDKITVTGILVEEADSDFAWSCVVDQKGNILRSGKVD